MKYNYEFTPQGRLTDSVSFQDGSELKAALVAVDLLAPLPERQQIIAERITVDLVSDIGRIARGYRPAMYFIGEEAELLDDALNQLHLLPDAASPYAAQARFMIKHAQTIGLAEESAHEEGATVS